MRRADLRILPDRDARGRGPADRPECAARGCDGAVHLQPAAQLVVETVNVKDKSGKPVDGLTAKDFTVTEDGVPQDHPVLRISEPAGNDQRHAGRFATRRRTSTSTTSWRDRRSHPKRPATSRYKDRRLLALYFDMTAMPPADQLRALAAAQKFIRTQMTPADLMAILRYAGGAVECCRISPTIATAC